MGFREGLRQLNALKQHRQLLLLLSAVVPLYQGVLVNLHQLHGCSSHHQAVAQHKLPYPAIVLQDQRPSRQGSLAFSFGAWMDSAKSDEDGLHQTATVRPLSRSAACTQHTSGGALDSRVSGTLWHFEASTQQSLTASTAIHHPFLVPVIQVLPKSDYGVGFLVGQAEGCVGPEIHQIFCQLVHMLITRDILVVNSLLKNTNTQHNYYITSV